MSLVHSHRLNGARQGKRAVIAALRGLEPTLQFFIYVKLQHLHFEANKGENQSYGGGGAVSSLVTIYAV